ncbi:hypothetical protein HK098_005483 [Nowakowskiella sp. JEL0407]|nr:hypothetical protein HK098_005483 [Nowakowskiella sp. JEL0407]
MTHPGHWFHLYKHEFFPEEQPEYEAPRATGEEQTCGMNLKAMRVLLDLVEEMASSYEDWFQYRSEEHDIEQRRMNHLINVRKKIRSGQDTAFLMNMDESSDPGLKTEESLKRNKKQELVPRERDIVVTSIIEDL